MSIKFNKIRIVKNISTKIHGDNSENYSKLSCEFYQTTILLKT